MILTTVIIVLVLAITFVNYTQGFFSATISAMLAIISAVLAFSLHERIVESYLGGRFSDTAHGITLAVLFALIYFVLRVAFDSMVPGNVRFPVIVDKVGGAAMGLIAGLFAGGIVAIVAQYMPLMPSVGGYARYAVDTRSVVVPSEATGRRSLDSEVWDKLKGEKPGQFEPSDKQSMILPMDDLVVGTVNHLSDGGSLGWDKPLSQTHPDFLQELFAQRLGVQTKANRVATKDAVREVDLFRADSLQRRDHDYKELRSRPLDTTPLRPTPNQVLVIARVMFGRGAADSDGFVKFSPAMVRLVARQGTGAGAQWVDYYPIGTVDNAQVLYGSSLDDFLFVDAKGADKGADFAFLVDKSGFAEGGQGGPLVVSDGTFIEFKRIARQDLSGKQIKTPDKYKAAENIQVMRKKQAEAPPAPAPTAAAPGADLKEKLIGNWAGTSDTGEFLIEFKADGTLKYTNKPKTGGPEIREGTWAVVPEKTTADTLVITRTVAGATPNENTIKFNGDTSLTLTSGTNPPRQLTKR
jgi:uncharacterized membrane protein